MNIHHIKSYHERSLDEWNSTAIVISEAVNTAPTSQRSQAFMQVVLTLADIAGKNQARRENITRGAAVIFNSLIDGSNVPQIVFQKLPSTPTPPSFGARCKRTTVKVFSTIFVLTLIVGAFWFGRVSVQPRIASLLPITSQISIDQDTSPEQIVQQFLESVRQGNAQQVLTLFHPDTVRKKGGFLLSETAEIIKDLPIMRDITILNADRDDSAQVLVNFTYHSGETETGTFTLKHSQARWYIMDFDI